MDAVLKAVKHGRSSTKNGVFHDLLSEVLVAAFQAGFYHFGQALVSVDFAEENLRG